MDALRRWLVSGLGWLALCLSLAGAAEPGLVIVVPVRTEISAAQATFLRRAVKEAERRQANALVLEMDTYGGSLPAAIDEMEVLLKTTVPTITWIDHKAISAGALISLATQRIYMTPGAVIGAAAPVDGQGQDLSKTMAEKTVSAVSAIARGAAEKCGHNPDLADCFMRREARLVIGGIVLDGPETLLSMNAKEATRKIDGHPVLAEGVAGSLEEVLGMAGLTGRLERVEPTGFERLSTWLTVLAPLLLLCALGGAWIEIKSPGFGLPGIVSAIAFALFFGGSYMAGLSGWEAVVLFLLGLLLVLSEVFLHPGTILPGVAGIVLIMLSLVWAMVDRFPGDPLLPTSGMLQRPLLNLCLALGGTGLLMALLAKYLPKSTLFRRLVLETTDPGGVRPAPRAELVGMGEEGIACTTLRPSGKADFGHGAVDVISQGEFVPSGRPVRVVEVHGPRIVVTAV